MCYYSTQIDLEAVKLKCTGNSPKQTLFTKGVPRVSIKNNCLLCFVDSRKTYYFGVVDCLTKEGHALRIPEFQLQRGYRKDKRHRHQGVSRENSVHLKNSAII